MSLHTHTNIRTHTLWLGFGAIRYLFSILLYFVLSLINGRRLSSVYFDFILAISFIDRIFRACFDRNSSTNKFFGYCCCCSIPHIQIECSLLILVYCRTIDNFRPTNFCFCFQPNEQLFKSMRKYRLKADHL